MGLPLNRVATEGCPYNLGHVLLSNGYNLFVAYVKIQRQEFPLTLEKNYPYNMSSACAGKFLKDRRDL